MEAQHRLLLLGGILLMNGFIFSFLERDCNKNKDIILFDITLSTFIVFILMKYEYEQLFKQEEIENEEEYLLLIN